MSMEQYEDSVNSFDQTTLAYRYWQKSPSPKKQIIITHGIGEHGECYEELTQKLIHELDIRVISWDMRGHGLSGGRRGYVNNFSDLTRDFKALIKELKQKELIQSENLNLFAHSLGGLVTAKALMENKIQAQSVVLSSPAFGLAMKPPRYKVLLGHIGSKRFPALTMDNELNPSHLTHDKERLKSYERDSLRHSRISPRLFTGMLESFDWLSGNAAKLKTPTLIQIPGKDKIISAKSSVEFSKKLDKNIYKLIQYEKSFHEIYNDIEKDAATHDMIQFLGDF